MITARPSQGATAVLDEYKQLVLVLKNSRPPEKHECPAYLSYFASLTELNAKQEQLREMALAPLRQLITLKRTAARWDHTHPMHQAGTTAWQKGAELLQCLLKTPKDSQITLLRATLQQATRVVAFNPNAQRLQKNITALERAKQNVETQIQGMPENLSLKKAATGFLGALTIILGLAVMVSGFILFSFIPPSLGMIALLLLAVGGGGIMGAGVGILGDAMTLGEVPQASNAKEKAIGLAAQGVQAALTEIIQIRKKDSPFHWFGFWRLNKNEQEKVISKQQTLSQPKIAS
jgi:hypothetical protein